MENGVTQELYTGRGGWGWGKGAGEGTGEKKGRRRKTRSDRQRNRGLKEKKERGQRKWSELAKVYDRKGGHDRSSKQVSWPRLAARERPVPPSFLLLFHVFLLLVFSPSPVAVAFSAYARGTQFQNYTCYHSGYRDGRWSPRGIVVTRNGYINALRQAGPGRAGPVLLLVVRASASHEATNLLSSLLEIMFYDRERKNHQTKLPVRTRKIIPIHRQINVHFFFPFECISVRCTTLARSGKKIRTLGRASYSAKETRFFLTDIWVL